MPTPALLDPKQEHSFVMIKPDGFRRGLIGEVLRRIEAKGYSIKGLKIKFADQKLLEEHYFEHKDKPFFPELVDYMTSGPVVACIIEGDRVIEGMRNMLGATNPTLAAPGTIRGDLGRAWNGSSTENVVHASDSETSAVREIGLWFPELEYDAHQ